MRILHIMPHYFPAVRYGGPIRSVQGLAAATAALGHDVHVYTTNVDGAGVSNVLTGRPIDLNGVKVWYFPSGFARRIFRSSALGVALDETVATFDVIHIHYIWVWTTIRAAAAARRSSTPYILAPRGMLVADLIRRRTAMAKYLWLAAFARRDVAGAAAVHATSALEASELNALGLAPRRIAIIPNGVELAVEIQNVQKYGSGSSVKREPYILFLGRISWKKGLDRLVRALPCVDAVLVIAGYNEDGQQGAVERLAAECGVQDRVRFIGPVEGSCKQRLIDDSVCLVLPSYNENFGMVVVEAMAAGRPVVVTPEVGLAAMVEQTGSGIVTGGDASSLAAALNYIIHNPGVAHEMGARGRRVAEERYGWTAVAQQAVQLYEECCIRVEVPPDADKFSADVSV